MNKNITVRTLILMGLFWMGSAHAELFRIQQTPVGTNQVQITVLVEDLVKLRDFLELPTGSDIIYAELSANLALTGAWVPSPADSVSFVVPRQTDFTNVSQFDSGSEKTLVFEALVKMTDLRRLNANDPVFSITLIRPTLPGASISLPYINLGAGNAPLPEDVAARLAELGESSLATQAAVAPAGSGGGSGDVPLPAWALVLLAGGLIEAARRRKAA